MASIELTENQLRRLAVSAGRERRRATAAGYPPIGERWDDLEQLFISAIVELENQESA